MRRELLRSRLGARVIAAHIQLAVDVIGPWRDALSPRLVFEPLGLPHFGGLGLSRPPPRSPANWLSLVDLEAPWLQRCLSARPGARAPYRCLGGYQCQSPSLSSKALQSDRGRRQQAEKPAPNHCRTRA